MKSDLYSSDSETHPKRFHHLWSTFFKDRLRRRRPVAIKCTEPHQNTAGTLITAKKIPKTIPFVIYILIILK